MWSKHVALVLTIVAYWVVFGLPVLMGWRIYRLFKVKGKPTQFYVGSLIFFAGILMWVPYCYLRRIVGVEISVIPFLILHLIGVFGGRYLRTHLPTQ